MGAVTAAARKPWVTVAAAVAAALVLSALTFLIGRGTKPSPPGNTPGAVDIGFSQDMATHHDQAVLMANLAITRGDSAVKGIADSILTIQSQELGQLRGWLQLWGKPAADPYPMSWMPHDSMSMPGMQSSSSMPGMASPTQLATLYSLTGKQFDVLFLQLMIRHHQGGIEMAHYAEVNARMVTVRAAATAMRVEQAQDLAYMQPLLTVDGGQPLPTP